MAGEDIALESLTKQIGRLAARDMISVVLHKYILSEVATIGRSPKQADSFIQDMRSKLEFIASALNNEDTELDNRLKREMLTYIELVFSGISFDRDGKP